MSNEGAHPSEFQGPRPICPADELARKFPTDLFTPTQLIGQLFPRTTYRNFQNWTNVDKPDLSKMNDKDYSEMAKHYGWHPEILKGAERWLIKINSSLNRFGIDSLKLGLNNTVDFGWDAILLPYIHFKNPKFLSTENDGIGQYGVADADLILLNRWQIDGLKSIVESIDKTTG